MDKEPETEFDKKIERPGVRSYRAVLLGLKTIATKLPMEVDVRANSEDFAANLERARAGDPGAIGDVLNRCRGYLLAMAMADLQADLRPKTAASDIVQETLLDGQRDFARFKGTSETDLLRWLQRILKHNLIDAVRVCHTQKRDARRELEWPTAESNISGLVDQAARPSQVLQQSELVNAVDQAIDRLPVRHKTVILLHHKEGLGFSEIGRRLGVSDRMARHLWAQAIPLLRQLMAEAE